MSSTMNHASRLARATDRLPANAGRPTTLHPARSSTARRFLANLSLLAQIAGSLDWPRRPSRGARGHLDEDGDRAAALPDAAFGPDRGERIFYAPIESLRGIAALMVAGFHASQARFAGEALNHASPGTDGLVDRWLGPVLPLLLDGRGAVVLFFVISGFVLSLARGPAPLLGAAR